MNAHLDGVKHDYTTVDDMLIQKNVDWPERFISMINEGKDEQELRKGHEEASVEYIKIMEELMAQNDSILIPTRPV